MHWLNVQELKIRTVPLRIRAAYCMHIYIFNIRHIFIQHKHITDLCIRSRHSEVNTMCMYFFIDMSYQRVAHETVMTACLWDSMMYLCFIYLCFLICSTHFQKKNIWFWIWGIWRSCTKCSKLFEKIQNAKMQWLAAARKIQERCNFIFYRFVLMVCFLFALICSKAKFQASVKTYLAHKHQA